MNLKNITLALFSILILLGCKKELDISEQSPTLEVEIKNVPPKGFFIENRKVPGVALTKSSEIQKASNGNAIALQSSSPDPNNGDIPIILGQQLANPYTIANMQQAVNILYGANYPIVATHLYVRFRPSSVEQFMMLEEIEDLELQDYPMDYELVQDGDFYQDSSLGTEDFGWLYTVVPAAYNFPSGIQNEILASLYLPEDNEILEDLAESIAAGGQYQSSLSGSNTIIIERLDVQVENFEFEPDPCYCDPTIDCEPNPFCEGGGGGGGGGSVDARIPRGKIEVQDVRVCGNIINNVPVRQARIVCKRWFKIDRIYTDDQGQFVSTKKFKNKVKVNLKTKNNNAVVRKVRGIRLWQMLFPVKKRIGVFDQGALANISFLFTKPNPTAANDAELPYWVAVTTHNSVLEYREYATEFGVGLPPMGLKIFVTNWGFQRAAGAAPMWNKCSSLSSDFSTFQEFIEFFIAQSTYVSQANLFGILKNEMDVIIGYAALFGDYNCRLTSPDIKTIAYHEFGHTSHYAQAGCDYWQAYRVRIANELITTLGADPYGDGTETNAGVVAVGEMWGNHIQYLFTNRHYGNGGANGAFGTGFTARLQRTDWPNEVGGLNAYLRAIENFNPNLVTDPHRWIPQGLPYDLIDNRNDIAFPNGTIVDNTFGFTSGQLFNALQPDVRSIPEFRMRLIQQTTNLSNLQLTQLNALFDAYNY